MKNRFKFLGIAAIAAVGLALMACPTDGGGGDGSWVNPTGELVAVWYMDSNTFIEAFEIKADGSATAVTGAETSFTFKVDGSKFKATGSQGSGTGTWDVTGNKLTLEYDANSDWLILMDGTYYKKSQPGGGDGDPWVQLKDTIWEKVPGDNDQPYLKFYEDYFKMLDYWTGSNGNELGISSVNTNGVTSYTGLSFNYTISGDGNTLTVTNWDYGTAEADLMNGTYYKKSQPGSGEIDEVAWEKLKNTKWEGTRTGGQMPKLEFSENGAGTPELDYGYFQMGYGSIVSLSENEVSLAKGLSFNYAIGNNTLTVTNWSVTSEAAVMNGNYTKRQ